MKKIIICILFSFFIFYPCHAEEIDEMLWDYQPDSFLESLKNDNGFYDEKTQKDLDKQIIKGLDITHRKRWVCTFFIFKLHLKITTIFKLPPHKKTNTNGCTGIR